VIGSAAIGRFALVARLDGELGLGVVGRVSQRTGLTVSPSQGTPRHSGPKDVSPLRSP
jgi:hypothetical protein